jgi:Protein of unknown function (DUF4235)
MASNSSKIWSAFSLGAALLAAAAAKKGLNTSWRVATGKNPPANPADPEVDLWEAVAWAAVSGTIIGLARMLATRRAASYYARSTGKLPPELAAKRDADESEPPTY